MPNILIYNPTTKQALYYLHSVDEQEYFSRVGYDAVISPVLPNCEQQYMVVNNIDNTVREMTQEEKDALIIANTPKPTFDDELQKKIAAGFYDEITRFTFPVDQDTIISKYTPAMLMLLCRKDKEDLSHVEQTILDIDGKKHTFTGVEYVELLSRILTLREEKVKEAMDTTATTAEPTP